MVDRKPLKNQYYDASSPTRLQLLAQVLDIDLPKSDLELAKLMQELAEDERQHPTYNLGFFVGVLWLMADRAYIPTEPHSSQARLDAGGNFLV